MNKTSKPSHLRVVKDLCFSYKDGIDRFLSNITNDFDIVCNKIGITRFKLPHIHKTDHKPYWKYYTDETRELVAKLYANDIETFGYKFGE